ncbi:MAG: hypothetical protein Q8Q59_08155 [Luteolibacter sp.]|jgi:chromosome segregation ATPase|nr:hypothetical protein [Luteolibacter sp.]
MKHLLLFIALTGTALAQQAAPVETQLREQLRATALQLRAAETEKANALATYAAAQTKIAELEAKIAAQEKRSATLAQQINDDRAASEKNISALNNKVADRDKRLAEYAAALEKWKAGYQNAANAARGFDADRARLASENSALKNTLADRECKNIALFNTASEILVRYEKHALGKSLAAREPFIGNSRVKIENLVQGYNNRIIDNRISAKP